MGPEGQKKRPPQDGGGYINTTTGEEVQLQRPWFELRPPKLEKRPAPLKLNRRLSHQQAKPRKTNLDGLQIKQEGWFFNGGL